MNIPDFSRITQRYKHLMTIQNAGLVVALVVALSWVYGAVVILQKNYTYQRQVDLNNQRIELAKLQNKTYEYQQAYFKSDEYLELSARSKLGLTQPGEHLVILPSSETIKDKVSTTQASVVVEEESNFTKWMRFFFEAR